MSLIGKKVESFKAKAFHNGQFIDITDENMRGKWSAVVFYPADFTFVCPFSWTNFSIFSYKFGSLQFS